MHTEHDNKINGGGDSSVLTGELPQKIQFLTELEKEDLLEYIERIIKGSNFSC